VVALKYEVMTKPIVILVLGCLPLAVLTLASFVGIADLDSELPSIDERDLARPGASASVPSRDLEGDEILCAAIAEREFLAGEPLPEHATVTEPLYLDSLAGGWQHWSDAAGLVRDVLALEQSLLGAGLPQLESALDRIGKIQDACRKKDPAGSARLVRVLERRSRELQAEIALRKNREKARQLLREAEQAFEDKNYEETITICDRVLADYAAAVDYQTVAKLRGNALFWREWSKLPLDSSLTEEPAKQRDMLVDFLDTYRDLPGQVEQERVARVSRRLDAIQTELRRIEMNEAAQVPIAALARYDGRAFTEGLAEAAQVAESYPTDSVRGRLQERVVLWVAASLPQKLLDEPDGMEEVEMISGNVLRGFFEPVTDAGGGVIGYKRYSTAAERENPTRNVGRYPAADLRGVPTHSVPRQCVDAYESARRRLLADPGSQDCWSVLKRTCDSAEATLIDYRRKPGSSPDAISFEKESRFATTVLAPGVWSQLGAIWGK
jgi:hypothetical protein